MMPKKKPVQSMLIIAGFMLLIILILQPLQILHWGEQIIVLFPKGLIAKEELNLLIIVQILMLLVIIPVYILTFVFSWIYRADNPKGKYDPNLTDNWLAECIWWGIPFILVFIVSVLIWVKTEELDPFKRISSKNKEKTIQVVALQWKWLFIYPEEKVASINFLQIPKETPIHFEITGDAPMNSFWIPALGGQIYAMPNMKTELNLIADHEGEFRGSSANISGEGFSRMVFTTKASSDEEYNQWISQAKESSSILNLKEYESLALPSKINPVTFFKLEDDKLFDQILNQYMQKHE